MHGPVRPNRRDTLSVVAALLLWTGSASFGYAAGFWTCSGGAWVSVGQPQYAMPLKTCGSQLERPRTQAACEQAGGRWGPAGLFPKPICRMPTHDGGRTCADNGECEGLCLAALTPPQRDLVQKKQKLPMLGKCTSHAPVFGCMAIVKEGIVSGLMCLD